MLHHADYRDVLPTKDECWIVTDPPYNVGYAYPEYSDSLAATEYRDLFRPLRGYRVVMIHYAEAFFSSIVPVLGNPQKCVAWCYNANTAKQWRMIAWFNCQPNFSKVKQPYKNLNDTRILELLASGSEGADLYNWWNVDLVKNVSSEKWDYVNQIPEEIIRRILLTTVPAGEMVFDPFCGSGTTPSVARRLGYGWSAADISEEALRVATARMSLLELPLNA